MREDRKALAEKVSRDDVVRAMRTFESMAGTLRYPEKDGWHTSDMIAMRRVLEEFAGARSLPVTEDGR